MMFALFPSRPAALSSSPQIQIAAAVYDVEPTRRRSDRLLPKTSLLEVSETAQLEARRGKGLAIEFPPLEKQKEKK